MAHLQKGLCSQKAVFVQFLLVAFSPRTIVAQAAVAAAMAQSSFQGEKCIS